jgi:hypothetical protein
MPASTETSSAVLSPTERILEVLFGLIMVLSFTCTLSVATAQREDVREMLIAALGCNLAWAIVDAVMYMMDNLLDRGRRLSTLHAVRRAPDPDQARATIAAALPPLIGSLMLPGELENLRQRLTQLPEPPAWPAPTLTDLRGATGVFLLVLLSTFPVALPFVFIQEARLALHVSNGVAIALLFAGGVTLGRYAGLRPLVTGLIMVALGVGLVLLTIALGG